jgi:hypothetical protein
MNNPRSGKVCGPLRGVIEGESSWPPPASSRHREWDVGASLPKVRQAMSRGSERGLKENESGRKHHDRSELGRRKSWPSTRAVVIFREVVLSPRVTHPAPGTLIGT